MIVEFEDSALCDLYELGKSKAYKAFSKNKIKIIAYKQIVDLMMVAENIEEIKLLSYLHYEKLKHNYSGYSSVRIKNGEIERLIFKEENDKITITLIELSTNHYGNK